MQGLASLAIEKVLGIETSHTVWNKHLYELAGFKRILGSEIVEKVIDSSEPDPGTMVDFPTVDVEIRKKPPYKPLQAMLPVHLEIGRASCRERVCQTCRSRWSPDN